LAMAQTLWDPGHGVTAKSHLPALERVNAA
jgi:hypothetical protein